MPEHFYAEKLVDNNENTANPHNSLRKGISWRTATMMHLLFLEV